MRIGICDDDKLWREKAQKIIEEYAVKSHLPIRIMKIREMEQENEWTQSYMDAMQEFYLGIQEGIEATRKYRHDLAKHIQTMETLLKGQNLDYAYEYRDNLKEQYELLKGQEFCSDEIVNAILNIKREQCCEKKIALEIEVEDTIYNEIEEADLVSVLHNLLDNAIEANERIFKEEERGIWFGMKKESDHIVIEMKNRIIRGEKITFQTHKARKEEHGIGTKIIEMLVKKYHGTRTWQVQEEQLIFEDRIELVPNR